MHRQIDVFHPIWYVYYYHCCCCCCLTLLMPPVGCYIMGHESETLPSFRWLSNRSYSIIKYIYSHLRFTLPPVPRPGPTTSLIYYNPESSPPPFTAHILAGSQCVPQWLSAAAECTPLWSIALIYTGRLPLGSIVPLCIVRSETSVSFVYWFINYQVKQIPIIRCTLSVLHSSAGKSISGGFIVTGLWQLWTIMILIQDQTSQEQS